MDPTTTTGTPRTPEDGILAVWTMSGGECGDPCEFTGTFLADGTLLWSSGRGGAVVDFDPDEAISVNGSLGVAALTVGSDDCGREVDRASGNATPMVARVSVPQEPCNPVTAEVCPVLVHELFESGLVIVSAPSSLAGAAPVPIEAREAAPGLAAELRGLIDTGLDRDDLCTADLGEGEPIPTTYGFVTDPEWSEVVGTRGCVADPDHPAVVAADRIVAG